VNNWPRIIQNWLYPPTCLLCDDPGQPGLDLCEPCARTLPYIAVACPRCAVPLAVSTPQVCGRCQKKSPVFDTAFAPLRYQEPVRHLIRSLKFGARYPAARLLGTLLAEALHDRPNRPEALIPVPLHRSRYRERGFNQAAEIARVVSRRLGIPLDLTSCTRIRTTPAQARLSAKERRENLRNAFAVRPGLNYRHVAILDDVVTTGTTADELAKVLRKAGAERIEVWACARTGRP
jgi:ComF family protein